VRSSIFDVGAIRSLVEIWFQAGASSASCFPMPGADSRDAKHKKLNRQSKVARPRWGKSGWLRRGAATRAHHDP